MCKKLQLLGDFVPIPITGDIFLLEHTGASDPEIKDKNVISLPFLLRIALCTVERADKQCNAIQIY